MGQDQTGSNGFVEMRGVRTHNLKNIDIKVPHNALTVVSGVSGSGKSSLAFDTLYAEGQRRFVSSLSTYARQFLQRMEKPPVDSVESILPALALQQKNTIKQARSSVATLTEIASHLQLLFAHAGQPYCPSCQIPVQRDTPRSIAESLESLGEGRKLLFVADVPVLEIQTPQMVLDEIVTLGYQRIYLEGESVRLEDADVEELLGCAVFSVIVDRLKTRGTEQELRLREAIEAGLRLGDGKIRVVDITDKEHQDHLFQTAHACNKCGRVVMEPTPQLFSYNSPVGACPECSGFGKVAGLDLKKVVPDPSKSLRRNAIAPLASPSRARRKKTMIEKAMARGIAIDIPFKDLPEKDQTFILEGGVGYTGVRGFFKQLEAKRHKPSARITVARYRGYTTCPSCHGERLRKDARAVRLDGRRFDEYASMTIRDAEAAFREMKLSGPEQEKVDAPLQELRDRLTYLKSVGVGYLSLNRQSRTLSGGEVQRIHLTSSLGRMLTDTLYVLDEPTAGLHARDTMRLMGVLERLKEIGNSVLVVEHDPDVIRSADWVIEMGPQGGEKGGQILYQGSVGDLKKADTPTGEAIRKTYRLDKRASEKAFDPTIDMYLQIRGARENNLRGVDTKIPLHRLVCVTGVSGSGKSTLIHKCLFENYRARKGESSDTPGSLDALEGLDQIAEIILMRQGGMGRSSRSNLATYTKAWAGIRKLFGGLNAATERGFGPGSFSFNREGGRCEHCEGTGTITVEMHFMADIEVVCEECEGKRFKSEVLDVKFRDLDISEVLQLTVDEAMEVFQGVRSITNKLYPLIEVGLGYLRLGQSTSTLSGGEAQRLLLASYLGKQARSSKKSVLFVFDEPTIGLHTYDVDILLKAMRRIIAEGHSVLVVEHNIDFIAQADHVIDLGPGGGDEGGLIVAEGPPEEVAQCEESWTGKFLSEVFV